MLRTNSKQACENVRMYIIQHCNLEDNSYIDFDEVCYSILSQATRELKGWNHGTDISYKEFEYWCQGLPAILDTTYYLSRARDVLGDILEEAPEEKVKYKESDAERVLTTLIYRELCKGSEAYIYAV